MNIALVAHDGRKKELMEWAEYNSKTLSSHNLFATGTTGKLLRDIVYNVEEYDASTDTSYLHAVVPFKDNVTCLLSGPLGGDQRNDCRRKDRRIDILL